MNRVTELQCQAELPVWMEPLAIRIAELLRPELEANTRELAAVKMQLHDLVEVQLTFLEGIKNPS